MVEGMGSERSSKIADESDFSEKKQKPTEEPSINVFKDLKDVLRYLIFNPEANHIVMPLLLVLEAVALKYILANVQYTEIDYEAYMEQIWTIKDGETNYELIEGGTGPLVYPAGHVWIYEIMEKVTSGLDNLKNGQIAFSALYIATLVLQMVCYVLLQLPPWCVVLAVLSKRLHSIYVLRLFNDCFTTFFMVLTVLSLLLSARLQRKIFCVVASATYAVAISIKMNALLFLPGVLLALFQLSSGHLAFTLGCLGTTVAWQFYVARQFLQDHSREYWSTAFNFGRQFMYKWSVNWQFVEEEVFNSSWFHRTLLFSHLTVLALLLVTKFCSGFPEIRASFKAVRHPFTPVLQSFEKVTTLDVSYVLLVTNFVGVLFARSLHYQFLSWYHWTLPVLLNWSQMPMIVSVVWYFAHELCWNSYPPNSNASSTLFALNSVLLISVYVRFAKSSQSTRKSLDSFTEKKNE
ncbi:LAME_0F11364g1_1 [Lachancea meyersii CBS 8951]|uniref:Dol-P-Man:Man(5)GlcNAc(2)-PP-Dol alpha-1,3-mannosyltransferase n=1 Tax=Lachancea meyersii CBS 8951 TaxID=1266667 RepID=A0A1G4JW18_9SACH|nr:LAME_0F11364g1_1 [Lachancea meyersii CBS 8951]